MRRSGKKAAAVLLASALLGRDALAQSAATLLPNAEQTFVDSNGAPLAAGKVYFYIPNSTTPKATWQDSGEATPNTNPVVLDSAGRAIIYGSGTYRQVVKDLFGNTIWDQLTQGNSSGGTYVTPQAFGAKCDGVTNDRTAFFNANAAAVSTGMGLLVQGGGPGECVIGSNLSLTAPLIFVPGGILLPSNGTTITLSNSLQAGTFQIFDPSAGGLIRGTPKVHSVLPEWWGAHSDNTNAPVTTLAIQSAFDLVDNSSLPTGEIDLFGSQYSLNATITKPLSNFCPNLVGGGVGATFVGLVGKSVETPVFEFIGGSGVNCEGGVKGVTIVGDGNTVGVEWMGQDGAYANIGFQSGKMPFLWCNCASTVFSENDVGTVQETNSNGITNMFGEMRVNNSGAASFRGSGIGDDSVVSITGSQTPPFLLLDNSALWYQGQFGFQLTADDSGTGTLTIIHDLSALPPQAARGSMRIETVSGPVLTMSPDSPFYFGGRVTLNGADFGSTTGLIVSNLVLYGEFFIGADNVFHVHQAALYNVQDAISTTAYSPNPPFHEGVQTYYVLVKNADNSYNWQGTVIVQSQGGSGGVCTVATVTSHLYNDTHSYGAPTITCAMDAPVFTNGNYTTGFGAIYNVSAQ